MSDHIERYCKAHQIPVRIDRLDHPMVNGRKAVLLSCEHTYGPTRSDVLECNLKCVYSDGIQMGALMAASRGAIPLNPDGTVPLGVIKEVGFIDHTVEAEDETTQQEPGHKPRSQSAGQSTFKTIPAQSTDQTETSTTERPGCITVFTLGVGLWALLIIVSTFGMAVYTDLPIYASTLLLGAAFLLTITVIGLWHMRNWARIIVIVLQAVGIAWAVVATVFLGGNPLSILLGVASSSFIIFWFVRNRQRFV